MSERDKPIPLSPLADPVVGAIFSDAEHAGLAAASLIGAVLACDGVTIGKVLSVTPQRHHKYPDERGIRIDVEIITAANEAVIIEVQLHTDMALLQRNLFAAARVFVDRVPEGTQP
ncbi:MAG: PD-(D/E)XK nuclease family transposase, partial [Treponema sp.]|nr:PD-(D/E)XK nuclease family transposase [Treponema sp.]MDR1788047.1 PD-(D/E)XK nuclease family transposase [Treponema sp.]